MKMASSFSRTIASALVPGSSLHSIWGNLKRLAPLRLTSIQSDAYSYLPIRIIPIVHLSARRLVLFRNCQRRFQDRVVDQFAGTRNNRLDKVKPLGYTSEPSVLITDINDIQQTNLVDCEVPQLPRSSLSTERVRGRDVLGFSQCSRDVVLLSKSLDGASLSARLVGREIGVCVVHGGDKPSRYIPRGSVHQCVLRNGEDI